MSEVSPEALAAARATLAANAAQVAATPVGEPTGDTSAIASDLAASGGQPAAADTDKLLAAVQEQAKQIQALQAQYAASQPAAAPATAAAKVSDLVAGSVSAPVHHAFSVVEDRLAALEAKLGLHKDSAEA